MLFKLANNIAESYLSGNNIDVVDKIVKVAQDHNLNPHQIENVVHKINRNIIVGLHKEAVQKNSIDWDFVFPTIKTADVIKRVNSNVASPNHSEVVDSPVKEVEITIVKKPQEISDYIGHTSFPNKYTGLAVLDMLKMKIEQKRYKLFKLQHELDCFIKRLKNEAVIKLASGTPVEVMRTMPCKELNTDVINETIENGYKLASLENKFFEVDREDSFVKKAYRVDSLKSEIDNLNKEIVKDDAYMRGIKLIVDGMGE